MCVFRQCMSNLIARVSSGLPNIYPIFHTQTNHFWVVRMESQVDRVQHLQYQNLNLLDSSVLTEEKGDRGWFSQVHRTLFWISPDALLKRGWFERRISRIGEVPPLALWFGNVALMQFNIIFAWNKNYYLYPQPHKTIHEILSSFF